MPIITATTTTISGCGGSAEAATSTEANNGAMPVLTTAMPPTGLATAPTASSDYLITQQNQHHHHHRQQQLQQQQQQHQQYNSHYYLQQKAQQQQLAAMPSVAQNASHQHLHAHSHSHGHPVASTALAATSSAGASTSFATFNGNSSLNSNLANGSNRNHVKKFNCSDSNSNSETIASPPIGMPPPAIKKPINPTRHASREDVASIGGTSSLNSQASGHNPYAVGSDNGNANGIINGVSSTSPDRRGPQPSSILKGSKENLLQSAFYNGEGGGSSMGSECGTVDVNQGAASQDDTDDGLGPLPPKWETAYTERGELYFIDHNTGTSHWLDPRLSKYQKKSLEDCCEDELPYGWEKIEDSMYGMYFIDHVNRRTQYENPVLEAKRRVAEQRQHLQQQQQQQHIVFQPPQQRSKTPTVGQDVTQLQSALPAAPSHPKLPYKFTRNPAELQGQRINASLVKSTRGLGFTIVGSDGSHGCDVEEFLQIKTVVPNGPAWIDGQLQTGDVLVYVNDTCVLGYTHHDMVNIFQSILAGETAALEVCRGYPLPFDPNDPNTEVVTTMAVDGLPSDSDKLRRLNVDLNMDGNYNFLDLSGEAVCVNKTSESGFILMKKPEIFNFSIVKGTMGFGFTIADSACGQIVKKILDHNCCAQLLEGDVLLEINGINVRNKPHFYVVELLKECSLTTPTALKIQRTSSDSATAGQSNQVALSTGVGSVSKLTKNFIGGTNSGLFRSKTPTADLYSTQTKEVLPMRPKTPLVDTRRARVLSPSNELMHSDADVVVDSKSMQSNQTAKSNNSLQELDDIPFLDPYPKMVSRLTERLADATLQDGTDADVDVDASGNYNPIYGLPPSMQPLPLPLGHHESCYCYDCQAQRYQRPPPSSSQLGYYFQQPTVGEVSDQYSPRQVAHIQNERIQRRVNDLLSDRRRVGFANLDPPQQLQLRHSPSWSSGALLDVSEDADQCELTEVTLERQAMGFGFRIVGGTEEGSQVTVGHIVPGGSADNDHRIATGDEILSIDGINVLNSSHHKVVSLVGESAVRGQVTMILRRRRAPQLLQQTPLPQLRRYPYDVIVSRHENEGFGFVIISSSNHYYGSTIGKLIPGSPADRCNELKVGDRIIAVNRIDIAGMSHGDVVNLIKESGLHVRLTIGCPLKEGDPSPGGSSAGLGSNTPLQASPSLLKPPPQQQQQQQHQHSLDMPGLGQLPSSFLERPSTNIAATLALHQQQPQL